MTLAQTDYCLNNKLDPEDPRCAHVILTGKFVKVSGCSRFSIYFKSKFPKTWLPVNFIGALN